MSAAPVLKPLRAAGVRATVRDDGRLLIRPVNRITPELDAYIRAHRDEVIRVLAVEAERTHNRILDAVLKSATGRLTRKQSDWLAAFDAAGAETFTWHPEQWHDGTILAALKRA